MNVPERGFRLRTEISDEKTLRIVEIVTNAETLVGQPKMTGLLLTLDCIKQSSNEAFWASYQEQIDELHMDLKRLFFGIIKQETLETLRPTYGDDPIN